ncbi:MAG: hypothetical protein Q8P79_00985 [Nanoarchaeota archaeon]|nr:hypothetical protein [Nanoarchaeota archaeon]
MEKQINEQRASLLEKAIDFVKVFFSEPWMYSSSDRNLPETRRKSYELMDRFYS